MNNRMIMIFPPGWTPFAPYLALPQLKGYLNEYGLDADIVDDNIIFFDNLLDGEYIKDKCDALCSLFDRLNAKDALNEEEQILFKRLIKVKLYEKHVKNIDIYKERLRTCRDILDKNAYEEIMQVFSVTLDIVNIFYNQSIDFTDIDFINYRRDNIEDIITLLDNRSSNIFVDYYSEIRYDLIEQILRYEFVGFSITSVAQLIPALTLCKMVRKRNKNIIIYFGGNYITRLVQQRVENLPFIFNYIDFISCYEGEYTLKELVEGKLTRENFANEIDNICNIVYYKNGKVVFNEIKDFDILDVKRPNFDGFDIKLYFNPILILPLFTSKNCYSNCAFCTISSGTGGKRYKVMSLDKVYEYMVYLKSKYNTKYFTFVDETFTFQRMLELSDKIVKDRNNDFLWYTETRFDYPITDEDGKRLYKGGLRKLQFGLESYNQRILDLMDKRIKLERIRPILESCMKNNISFHLFYILGFPKETKEEAITTVQFVENIINEAKDVYGLDECSKGLSAFGLEKGSKVYKNPDEYNIEIIPDDKNDIGIAYEYVAKEGLTEQESIQMINETIKNNSSRVGVDIPITRLLGEEFSLFFNEKAAEEMYDYNFKYLEIETCLKLRENPFSDETEICYLYYNFINNNSIVLKNEPSELTSFEKALLKTYDFTRWIDEEKDKEKMISFNPFVRYERQKKRKIILGHDIISGDEYELNEFIYESMQVLDKFNYNEAKDMLIKNEIYTQEEFKKFMENICGARLIVEYFIA